MKTHSIWGKAPTRLYKFIQMAEKTLAPNFTTCIVGCSDGKFLFPFARKKHYVTGLDIDDIALYGGVKNFPLRSKTKKVPYSGVNKFPPLKTITRKVIGIKERIELENLEKYTHIEKRDFYKNPPKEKFDLVFTSCSLHYTANATFSLREKVQKLQDLVAPNGFLYIDYMMAIDENDVETYPQNKFFRKGEIKNYFDKDWEIISLRENNTPSFEAAHVECVFDHYHKFGYVLARKKALYKLKQKEICWNITPQCNQNCSYCLKFLGIKPLSLKENLKILKKLSNSGITEITWGGGEPLIYPHIDTLLKNSWQLGIKNMVVSNGSLLNEKRINHISKYIDTLTLSIDSVSDEINSKIGRGKKHFKQIDFIINYIQKNYPKINLKINTVVCSLNKKEIKPLLQYLNQKQVNAWRIFRVMPLRERAVKNYDRLKISQQEFDSIKKYLLENSTIKHIDFREMEDMEKSYILLIANGDIMCTKNGKDLKKGNALIDDLNYIN